MTITEALKKLYKALGGEEDAAEVRTITEILNLIAELYGGEHADTIAGAIANIAEAYESNSEEPDEGEDEDQTDEDSQEEE